ncbi:MAG TPA: TFIIB-type zinc ribbon-containing protein [Nitrososphaeraceae archaeon]|nr:TFIIB-type zinc ribbon-containing protein [Nitrososphaeraceae archaeon]
MQSSIICLTCNTDSLITDPYSGEVVCSNCGQVVTDRNYENRQECRGFLSGAAQQITKNGNRTGIPTSLARHDMGLATVIGRANTDASGHELDPAMRTTMERLRVWDIRTQIRSSTDRNLRNAFNQLEKLRHRLWISGVAVEKTAYVYRKAQERGLVRGRTIPAVLAAAAYIACREMGTSKTLKDIAVAADIRRKDLSRTYRLLIIELDLKVPMIDPVKCIAKVANKAGLKEKTKRQAIHTMYEISKRGITAGKDPMGLAASALYLSSFDAGERVTQSQIADAAGVTEVTLRNRFRDLKSKLKLLN